MILERCRSHEKYNTPAAFEPVLNGTPAEIAAYYQDLTAAERFSNGYRVREDDGSTIDIQTFYYTHVIA